MQMNGASSGLCPVEDFDFNAEETSDSGTIVDETSTYEYLR
jgi:hypothetical protein